MSEGAAITGRHLLDRITSTHNTIVHLVRATGALVVAYVMTEWLLDDVIRTTRFGGPIFLLEVALFVALAAIALTVTSAIPLRRELMAINTVISDNDAELRRQNRYQRFARSVSRAFSMAEYERELFDVAGDALAEATPGCGEILVADASNAHVERVTHSTGRPAPGCGVTTPRHCPAVSEGKTIEFPRPNALSSCPRLKERALAPDEVAVCIPIHVLGTPSAVLHVTRERGDAAPDVLGDEVRSLEAIASRFGARLGLIRAMTQSRMQADTDPLTGLLNRRATENRVRELRADDVPFALAMADLDHFKDLNDTYGHDTGDRALRLFSRVVSSTVRDSDIVSRHGGEEFVIVLPGADVTTAAPILHRLRETLADTLVSASVPAFTVSVGLADSTFDEDYQQLLHVADRALLTAKHDGRDRIVIGDPDAPSSAVAAAGDGQTPTSRGRMSAI